MRECFTEKRFTKTSAVVIVTAERILEEYAAKGFDLTLRLAKTKLFQFSLIILFQFGPVKPPAGLEHTKPPVATCSLEKQSLRNRMIAMRPTNPRQWYRHELKSKQSFLFLGIEIGQQQLENRFRVSGSRHPTHCWVSVFVHDRMWLNSANTYNPHESAQRLLVTHRYLNIEPKGIRTKVFSRTSSLPIDVNTSLTVKQTSGPSNIHLCHNCPPINSITEGGRKSNA